MPPDLWERRDWKDLKLWFLEEEGEEDAQSVAPLIPQGESLQLKISSICLTLEAGVGHRTVPMLLAKSSFHGDVKNWSTLINLQCHLNMEVSRYSEKNLENILTLTAPDILSNYGEVLLCICGFFSSQCGNKGLNV